MGPGKWMNEWMINKAEKVDRKPREVEATQATTEPPKGSGMGSLKVEVKVGQKQENRLKSSLENI